MNISLLFFKVNIHLITYAGEFDGQNALEQSDLLVWMGDLPKMNHLKKVNKNNGKSSNLTNFFFPGTGTVTHIPDQFSKFLKEKCKCKQ